MKNPPNIESARVVEPGVLALAWSTGEILNVNLSDLPKRNTAFAKLADPAFFARVERDEWGHGIGWPGGLDLGADRLYELSREQAGLPIASKPIPIVVGLACKGWEAKHASQRSQSS